MRFTAVNPLGIFEKQQLFFYRHNLLCDSVFRQLIIRPDLLS